MGKRSSQQRILREETVIFLSILKWVALATAVGVIVGVATTIFLRVLSWSIDQAAGINYHFLLLPVALMVSSALVKYLAPDAEGHGTEKVIEAVHKRSGRIRPAVVPVKLGATVLTIAAGGSAGKEGPCAQIGAGLSSLFADLLRFDNRDRKKLVICGISAGFSAVFGTPIAGAIFGVEVLFVGSILYSVLLPSFIAGIVAYQVANGLGVTYFYNPLDFVPVFSDVFFVKVLLAGVFFGLVSLAFIEMLRAFKGLSERLKVWRPAMGLLGGMVLVVLALLFTLPFFGLRQDVFLGLGLDTIEAVLLGGSVVWFAFILKMVFTSVTLSFGGSGGIVTPIFFIGATAGSLYGMLTGGGTGTFAAIGFVALLAGAANTPIAASIMSVEMFGPAIAPYATVACVIAYLMSGHRSVYPSQILASRKSEALSVRRGDDMEDVTVEVQPRKKSLLFKGMQVAEDIEDRFLPKKKKPPRPGHEPE